MTTASGIELWILSTKRNHKMMGSCSRIHLKSLFNLVSCLRASMIFLVYVCFIFSLQLSMMEILSLLKSLKLSLPLVEGDSLEWVSFCHHRRSYIQVQSYFSLVQYKPALSYPIHNGHGEQHYLLWNSLQHDLRPILLLCSWRKPLQSFSFSF